MLLAPAFVFAQYGIDEAADGGGLKNIAISSKSVPEVIGDIVGVVLSLLGVAFFLLILYAGILWMTAFGVADKAEKAKEILIQASVGLIIVLSAYAISSFVFKGLGVGGGGSTQTGPAPATIVAGEPCEGGENMVWNESGECITLCEYSFPGGGASCYGMSSCEAITGTQVLADFCPGGSDNICCVFPP